jgi:hypothetical protein
MIPHERQGKEFNGQALAESLNEKLILKVIQQSLTGIQCIGFIA